MKMKKIILADNDDKYYTDIVYFNDDVTFDEVYDAILKAKEKEDYTNEDVYDELEKIGGGIAKIEFLGAFDYRNYFRY